MMDLLYWTRCHSHSSTELDMAKLCYCCCCVAVAGTETVLVVRRTVSMVVAVVVVSQTAAVTAERLVHIDHHANYYWNPIALGKDTVDSKRWEELTE